MKISIMFVRGCYLIRRFVLVLMLLTLFGVNTDVFAEQQDANKPEDFFKMSIEELMEVEVVSASLQAQKIGDKMGFVNLER